MMQKVRLDNVRKNQRVVLRDELPSNKIFGNVRPIKQGSRGDVTSDGFVAGTLKVTFYSHFYGKEEVQFNERSAETYLETDIF
jgi:hypothetical protein